MSIVVGEFLSEVIVLSDSSQTAAWGAQDVTGTLGLDHVRNIYGVHAH